MRSLPEQDQLQVTIGYPHTQKKHTYTENITAQIKSTSLVVVVVLFLLPSLLLFFCCFPCVVVLGGGTSPHLIC